MFEEKLYHIVNGENAKFTIRNRIIDGELFYYANVINTDLEVYKKLSDAEKEVYYGIEISDGQGNKINYQNVEELKTDILNKYGKEWLQTEK